MKNLSLLQLLFALALFGSVGQLGEFATMSWWLIFAPLILHYFLNFIFWLAGVINLKKTIDDEVIHAKAKRQLKKTDALYKTAVEIFKKDLKDGKI